VKKEFFKYLVVLLIAIGAGPAGAALWQWSLTPFTNGSVDPTVSWLNGQPSVQTEPSGRAMMARFAEYRDDISGSLLTTGTASALAVTTNQQGGANGICGAGTVPLDGQLLAITPNVTNGANAFLTVDSCSAFALVTAVNVPAPAGTLIAGTPYSLKYTAATTSWVLRNFHTDVYGVPLGGLMAYTAGSVPNSNFILPAGQCISTVTFASYWTFMGSPGVGPCGANQFQVVDLRGRAPVALDNLNGSAASRMTASGCGNAFTSIGVACNNGGESGTLTLAQTPTGITANNAAQSITVTGANSHTIYADGSCCSAVWVGGDSRNAANGSFGQISLTGSISLSTTSNNTGGSAYPNVQPSAAVSYLLRVI
jgi:hypothetical protein